jgi:hypothetical protein
MIKATLNILLCATGAGLALLAAQLGQSLLWLNAASWTVCMSCAGYWVAKIFDILDEREDIEALRQMVDTLEAAGVYSPEQAAGVRRDLLEQ